MAVKFLNSQGSGSMADSSIQYAVDNGATVSNHSWGFTTQEYLTVGFATPLLSTGVVIRETYGNGFVDAVEVRDATTGQFHLVSSGPDDSQPGTPVDYVVSWPQTTYAVDAVRITVDTNHSASYEEIDAVQLRGIVAPGPESASAVDAIFAGY